MDAVGRFVEALGPIPGAPAATLTSQLTTVLLLLVTVALWRLLGWSRQLRQPGAKQATRSQDGRGVAQAGGGGGGGYRGFLGSGSAGLPQQRGALAEVVRSHNAHWQREMPKTGAVSLAQAHALQWGADDLHSSKRSARARDASAEPVLPTYLWVVRAYPSRETKSAREAWHSRLCRHISSAHY